MKSKDLAASRNFEEAIRVANSILSYRRWAAIQYISICLANSNLEEAIRVANSIPNEFIDIKQGTFSEICKNLTESGDFKNAIWVANYSMSNENLRGEALLGISSALIKRHEFKQAIDRVALKDISRALLNFSRTLIQNDNIEKALEVATTIPDIDLKGEALREISKVLQGTSLALMLNGNIEKALEVTTTIPDIDLKGETFRNISWTLTQRGLFEKAIHVANNISIEEIKIYALRDICRTLANNGNYEMSLAVINFIPNESTRKDVLENLKRNNFRFAVHLMKKNLADMVLNIYSAG